MGRPCNRLACCSSQTAKKPLQSRYSYSAVVGFRICVSMAKSENISGMRNLVATSGLRVQLNPSLIQTHQKAIWRRAVEDLRRWG